MAQSASVPFITGGSAAPSIVNSQIDTNPAENNVVWSFTPTAGNVLLIFGNQRAGTAATMPAAPGGWTRLEEFAGSGAFSSSIMCYAKVSNGTETYQGFSGSVGARTFIVEVQDANLVDVLTNTNAGTTTAITTGAVTPDAGTGALIFGWDEISGDTFSNRTHTPGAGWTELHDSAVGQSAEPFPGLYYQSVASASGSPYNPSATASSINGGLATAWRGLTVAFFGASLGYAWIDAPDTIDADDASSEDVDTAAISATSGPFWRSTLDAATAIGELEAIVGFENTGSVTVLLQAATVADYSDAVTVATLNLTATGSLTADDFGVTFDAPDNYQYWQLVLDSAAQDVRVYEVTLSVSVEPPDTEPSKAILEIYVHDEDASRWGVATWATGAATGTEGIWSGAGWQDVTPEGVQAHIIWGSRRAAFGILAAQNGASWNVETYDPERILDPGNFDSPYYPQLVAGTPIRISHDSHVIRTGYIDRLAYKHKDPDFRGQLLATDTIALLNQATVPADSILGNTLLERVQDAINAAGIAVGGIPLPPGGPAGPAIAALDVDNPRERSVWDHISKACEEVLWVAYVDAAAGLGLRSYGAPLDRGREITAANLEDLEAISHEDGLYSVAIVQGTDPDIAPIERETAPLPRYGRRVIERTELTTDPEGWATAVLADRGWPGVQYVPGTIHCFTAADVDYFGSIEVMERVTITVPGAVSVTGRVLGGELFVEHRENAERGATWQFLFAVATDGASAIGLTTLVADGTGDTLVDDATETDYLEAD
jgi:hypothetical protein